MSEILEDLFDDNNNVNLAPVDTNAGLGETDLKYKIIALKILIKLIQVPDFIVTESCQMTTPIASPLRVCKNKTNVKKGGKAQMSSLTPKQMWDIIQKQSAKLQQKNRMIKCLKSALQRSNEKSKRFEKKLEEYPKVDIKIVKVVESLSLTEEHDVYAGIIMDQLRNFGKLKSARWNQTTISIASSCTRKVLDITNSYGD